MRDKKKVKKKSMTSTGVCEGCVRAQGMVQPGIVVPGVAVVAAVEGQHLQEVSSSQRLSKKLRML